MTRKMQIGWLAAGAALGFASVMLGPKLLDRMHSTASAETQLEKSASAFDQVAQVWAKPKGGNEEQEPTPSSADTNASQNNEKIKSIDSRNPESKSAVADYLSPRSTTSVDTATPNDSENASNENSVKGYRNAATEPQALPDFLPPQENEKPRHQEKPSIRLRGNAQEAVDPPPTPPVNKEAKSQDPEPSTAASIPPQSELASPPPVPEKRIAPQPQPSHNVPAPDANPLPPPSPAESRPPALDDAALNSPRTTVDLPAATQGIPSVAITISTAPIVKKAPAVAKTKSLPLTGMHPCTLDERKGVVLPKSLREQLGESDVVFLTPGADQSLWLTTAAGLEKLTDKMEKKTDSDEDGKVSRRRYYALTQRVAVDKACRLVLPAALAAGADLKQEVILIGVGDHVELWDSQRWQKYCQATEADSAMTEGH